MEERNLYSQFFMGYQIHASNSYQKHQDWLRQTLPKHGQQNKNTTKISAIKSITLKLSKKRLPRCRNKRSRGTQFSWRKGISFWNKLKKMGLRYPRNHFSSLQKISWSQRADTSVVIITYKSSNEDLLNGDF